MVAVAMITNILLTDRRVFVASLPGCELFLILFRSVLSISTSYQDRFHWVEATSILVLSWNWNRSFN